MSPEGPEVLLVEGEPTLQTALAAALLGAGYRVRAVSTAAEALAAIGDSEPPLVVSEVGLADLSGIELARRIREKHEAAEILLLAGSEDPRLAVMAFRAGAADYVIKQWEGVDELLRSLRTALARRESRLGRAGGLREIAALGEGMLEDAEALQRSSAEDRAAEAGGALAAPGSYRILLVDDEQVVLTVLGRVLTDEGFAVEQALDADLAQRRLDESQFDLIITDKNLPGRSGLDLLRHARERHPGIESILITGYGSLESAIEAVHLGVGAYLIKPFEDVGVIVAKVNELRAREAERRGAQRRLAAFEDRLKALVESARRLRDRLREAIASGKPGS